jgi:hypothetical protein
MVQAAECKPGNVPNARAPREPRAEVGWCDTNDVSRPGNGQPLMDAAMYPCMQSQQAWVVKKGT